MKNDLEEIAKKKGILYFLISFTDLFGVVRSKLVPAKAISGMEALGRPEISTAPVTNVQV